MKTTIVLAILAIGYGPIVLASTPRYLGTLMKDPRSVKIVNSTHLRRLLRPENSAPTVEEYLALQGLSNISPTMNEQQLVNHMKKTRELMKDWSEQYYPELTEEDIINVLSKDKKLRAKTVALILLFNTATRSGNPISSVDAVIVSTELATLVMAVDADVDAKELQTAIGQLEEGAIEIFYSDPEPRFGIGRSTSIYPNNRSYLARTNRFRHGQLPAPLRNVLNELGYTDPELIDKISPALAQLAVNDQIRPELDNSLIDLPASVAIDLLTEPGIIGDYVLTPYQLEASDEPIEYLARELEIDAESLGHLDAKLSVTDEENWLQMVVDLLDAHESPATLFQVTQLRRLGFNFDEIAELSYPAREAIIVSGYENREIFIERHGEVSKVNALVKKTGPLVYYLLRIGYEIKQINKHSLIDPAEIENDLQEIQLWQTIISGTPDNNS